MRWEEGVVWGFYGVGGESEFWVRVRDHVMTVAMGIITHILAR